MKNSLQKAGGFAAWAEALCYIAGFAIFGFLLGVPSSGDPAQNLQYLIDNKALIQSAMIIIYILAALILLVLVLALHDRLKNYSPALMQITTAIGLIWTGVVVASGMIFIVGSESAISLHATDPERAATILMAVSVVQNGLGGGTELLGGVWLFILSWVALAAGKLPKLLNYFGFFIGIAGILSVFPPLQSAIEIFGLGQIIWFIWLGFVMVRKEVTA